MKKAAIKTALLILLAAAFCFGVYLYKGQDAALQWMTGYILEYSLSVDNLFVFLMIFSYFQVPAAYQNKVLTWGILGAIVFRGIFIFAGVEIIAMFHWVIYLLGAFLIFTGIKMALFDEKEMRLEKNIALRLAKRFMRVISGYLDGAEGRFFVNIKFESGKKYKRYATPLFITLIVIETTDIMFAFDSVPAIFAVTNDAFIIYTSNIFAILGLRQLYFVLSGAMAMFKYIKLGLSVILGFIGAKMLLGGIGFEIPIVTMLSIICLILGISIAASIYISQWKKKIGKVYDC